MPPTHTDEAIRAALVIRRQYPDVALLVLSQYVEESYATDLLSAATTRSAASPRANCRCCGSWRRSVPTRGSSPS
jgi:hypothetical protein